MDEILGGGLPEGRTTLVSGGPSTGKTMLGLEFLYRSARAGMLEFLTVMPEAMGAERHLVCALRRIDVFGREHVVVDAISACKRIGDERGAFDYLRWLVDICKQRGITALLTNQLAGTDTEADFSDIGFSSRTGIRYMAAGACQRDFSGRPGLSSRDKRETIMAASARSGPVRDAAGKESTRCYMRLFVAGDEPNSVLAKATLQLGSEKL